MGRANAQPSEWTALKGRPNCCEQEIPSLIAIVIHRVSGWSMSGNPSWLYGPWIEAHNLSILRH
jgi:hypothetical protein